MRFGDPEERSSKASATPGPSPPSEDVTGEGNRRHMSAEGTTRATAGINGGRGGPFPKDGGRIRRGSPDWPSGIVPLSGRGEGNRRHLIDDKFNRLPYSGHEGNRGGGPPSRSTAGLERQEMPPHRWWVIRVTQCTTQGEGEGNVGRLRLRWCGLPPLKWDPCVFSQRVEDGCEDTAVRVAVSLAGDVRLGLASFLRAAAGDGAGRTLSHPRTSGKQQRVRRPQDGRYRCCGVYGWYLCLPPPARSW